MFRKLKFNAIKKYIPYAIGEIILVVLGILIALGINNWNENRKIRIEEKRILYELNEEFNSNISDLNISLKQHQGRLEANINLIGSFNDLSLIISDSLLRASYYVNTYEAKLGITNSLLNSHKIDIISNLDIKFALTKLPGIIEDYKEELDYALKRNSENLFPIIFAYKEPNQLKEDIAFQRMTELRLINTELMIRDAGLLLQAYINISKLLKSELEKINK